MNSLAIPWHFYTPDTPAVFACDAFLFETERLAEGRVQSAKFCAILRYEDGDAETVWGRLTRSECGSWRVRVTPRLPDALYQRVRRAAIERAEIGKAPTQWERRFSS